VLAYTTIMALGMVTMFLGGQSAMVLTAATTFLLVHALYKAAFFWRRASSIMKPAPGSSTAWADLARHAADRPGRGRRRHVHGGRSLVFRFYRQGDHVQGALAEERFPQFATSAALLANALMTGVAAILLLGPFAGKRPPALPAAHDPPWTMWIGPMVLGSWGILFGIIPGLGFGKPDPARGACLSPGRRRGPAEALSRLQHPFAAQRGHALPGGCFYRLRPACGRWSPLSSIGCRSPPTVPTTKAHLFSERGQGLTNACKTDPCTLT
jgi:hypothetical protein